MHSDSRTSKKRPLAPPIDLGPCPCGARRVMLYGEEWCSDTLAKFRLLHGEPTEPADRRRTHG
jgi:hypothetical protein